MQKSQLAAEITAELTALSPCQVSLSITISPKIFVECINKVFAKHRGRFPIDGFRKGRAPRKIIEQAYGADIFHEDAFRLCYGAAYEAGLDLLDVSPITQPSITLESASEKEGANFLAEVYTNPPVKPGDISNLTYPPFEDDHTADIEFALNAEQRKNARASSVERPAQMGDELSITFTGRIDGVEFEGGHGTDPGVMLGSGKFIPGFEEGLVGAKTGDDVEVNVTFPENYTNAELSGAAAVFSITVHDVRQVDLPPLDDDFATEVSEFDTLEEYREDLAQKIAEKKQQMHKETVENEIVRQITESAEFDIPEGLFEQRANESIADLEDELEGKGLDIDTYLSYIGQDPGSFVALMRTRARMFVESRAVMIAIAAEHGIEATEDDLNEVIKRIDPNATIGIEFFDRLPKHVLVHERYSIICKKVLEMLVERAKPLLPGDAAADAPSAPTDTGEAKPEKPAKAAKATKAKTPKAPKAPKAPAKTAAAKTAKPKKEKTPSAE